MFADYIEQPGGTEVTFTGMYAYASYFLTGENRNYNRKTGCFDRVKPFTNFFRVRTCDGDVASGWGAWEVGYRVTYVDMLDGYAQRRRATHRRPGPGNRSDPRRELVSQSLHQGHGQLHLHDLRPRGQSPARAAVHNHTVNTFEMRAQFDF